MKLYKVLKPIIGIIKTQIVEENLNKATGELNEVKHLFIEFACIAVMLKDTLIGALKKS